MNWSTNSCIAIIGKRGSGKSVFVREVFWNNLQSVVCHDRKMEHSYLNVPIAHTTQELEALWAQRYTKLLYQPWDSSYEDFDTFCEAIFNRGNMVLWVDEAASVTNSNVTPKWFGEIMRLGRTRGLGCLAVTQRPVMVSNLVFSEAELVVSFKLNLYPDALKVAQIAGERVVNTVMGLEPYHFIVSDGNDIQVCSPLILAGEPVQQEEQEVVGNESDGEIQTEQDTENQLEE